MTSVSTRCNLTGLLQDVNLYCFIASSHGKISSDKVDLSEIHTNN